MRIERIETLACDAGWRNYHFLKLVTDDGVVGWSEFDEAFGPPGLATVIERYADRLIGEAVHDHERLYASLAATARPAPYGLSAEAFGAIENALLDTKAKALGVPVYDLLGGKQRDVVPVYWSHSASWRINHPTLYTPAITDLDGVKQAGVDAPFSPGLNIDKSLIRSVRAHLEALRDGAGPDVEILLDLNFNARTEGFVSIIRPLEDFDLFWIEPDIHNPRALSYIRQQSRSPISSCETLFGVRQFLPYFQEQSMDVAIIDAVWNGVWQSMKIANTAEAFDVNIAPHNFYSHLATMMNIHFAAAVPNLRIMEHDVDRLPWDDELFTRAPTIEDGHLVVPQVPGWGTEPNEEALRTRPPKVRTDYLGIK